MAPVKGSKRRVIPIPDMAEMLARYKALKRDGIGVMEACEAVGLEFGRETPTIYALIRRMAPTTDIAEDYLKAQALRLAVRVVRKANASEAMEILSRKNVGVLAPKTEESGAPGGFFLSVQSDSCGAVKIGVTNSPAALPAASTPPVIDVEQESHGQSTYDRKAPRPLQGHIRQVLKPKQAQAVKEARERLRQSRRRQRRRDKYQKIGGVQATDGESEGPDTQVDV